MMGMAKGKQRPDPEKRSITMTTAVVASLVLHVLLVVFTIWVPVSKSAAEPPPEDTVLRFDFAPTLDDSPAIDEPARGDTMEETPPVPQQPEAPPQPEILEPSTESPGLPTLEAPPQPAIPPAQPAPTIPEPQQPVEPEVTEEPPVDAPTEDPAPEDPNEAVDESIGLDARPSDDPLTRDRTADRPSEPQRQPSPSVDMMGALQNYTRALERATKEQRTTKPGQGTQQNVYVPDPSSMPMRGAPFGILEFSSRDYDWSDYSSQIYWAILRAWYNRLYQTTSDFEKWAHSNQQWSLNHRSRITFTIRRTGNVTQIQLVDGSGCDPLDSSALDALSEVILPPLPADFPRDSETIRATFIARGDIMSMRDAFRYMKQIGYF